MKCTTIRVSQETKERLDKIKGVNSYNKTITALLNRNGTKEMLEQHRNEILSRLRQEIDQALQSYSKY